jgi:hypothetical protein
MNHELWTARERWDYDPNFIRCQAFYDEENVLAGFVEECARIAGVRRALLFDACRGASFAT